ncbi:hypothetical protein ACH0CG_07930 [Microbacterium sp. 179-I 1D1 NHS]|uniref:hypothetical protein n=1 Tax=Microbacterium sp. 179-I 1D1 NHS TaxID=3374298 RepID=UPI0038792F7C
MRSLRAPASAVSALALLLAGCSGTPTVDVDAASAWFAAVDDEPVGDAAAAVGMKVGPGSSGEVRADFEEPVEIIGADARCYGGDEVAASVTVNLMTADGGQLTLTEQIVCDTEPHRIRFGGAYARAVSASGTTPVPSYLYVTAVTAG